MCYFTFRFRSHKVVTAICLPHLNPSYSDVLGDDALGCARPWLPSWPLNKIFLTETVTAAAVLLLWKPCAVSVLLHDVHELLTPNMAPFVSLIPAFYPFFFALEASLQESLFSSLTPKTHFYLLVYLFSAAEFLPPHLLTVALSLPPASDKGSRN